MHDKLLEAMTRPECLAGIVPDNGGMWAAPCRPNRPRDFATNPATWNAFAVAYNGIGTRDFQFDLVVNIKEFPSLTGAVFYDTALGAFGLTVIDDSTTNFYFRFRNLVDGLNFSYVSASKASAAPQYNAPQLEIGKNYFRIKRTGTTLEITVNDYTFSATGTAILSPKIEFAQSMRSSYGSIEHASLSIQGAVEWEAAHSELYETDNPYPSATPRNFATEPATWSELVRKINAIGMGDFSFQIRFRQCAVDTGTGSFVLVTRGAPTFANIICTGAYLRVDLASTLGGGSTGNITGGWLNHDISVKIVRRGIDISIFVDGVEKYKSTNAGSPVVTTLESCNNGTISEIVFTGTEHWRYPSEAERVRLLTYTNVRTDRGCFESAGGTAGFYVKTPLKLRDIASFTVIARATLEEISGTYAWIFNLDENNFSGAYTGRGGLVFNLSTVLSTTATKYVQIPLAGLTGHEHTYAFQLDGATMRLFVDGVLRGELVLPDATRVAGEEMPLFVGSPNAFTQPFLSRVSALAVFDYAMNADEIKALS